MCSTKTSNVCHSKDNTFIEMGKTISGRNKFICSVKIISLIIHFVDTHAPKINHSINDEAL